MKTVALADGEETPKERALLEIVAQTLKTSAAVTPLAPSDLEHLGDTERERIVQCMLLMAVMDGVGARAEADLIETFADHLEVTDQRVHNFRQLAEGRIARMRFDLSRRGYAIEELAQTIEEEGLRGVYKTFGPIVGLATDPDLARRYIAFGEYAEGTLGRAYFDFITKNDLKFPGEKAGVAERGLWHDMTHVLGGYPITPVGEACIVAFIAGYRKEDPFFWLFTIALQFQVGVKVSPFSPGLVDRIDPRLFVLHHERGSKVKRDLSANWDIQANLGRPLEELRAELGIDPIAPL